MKKIINDLNNITLEMCAGMALAHPTLDVDLKYKILSRKHFNYKKVALISGGGSGHEPAHGGFVGQGMLDFAVSGEVFSSPSQIQVYKALKKSANHQGTLLIIKNYSGDMMNFKNAMDMANDEGIIVDYVKVDDDIAVKDSLYTVGNRGVAGTVFVHKIVGAAAEYGKDLAQIKELANKVINNVKTLGFALTSCTVPAKGSPTFILNDDEIEYGVGIHGEPGINREKFQSSQKLAEKTVTQILDSLSITKQSDHQSIAVLVNGFGATPLQELYAFYYDVVNILVTYPVTVEYVLVGNFMTSLDMAGASLSILRLDDELKSLLYAPCDAPAFKQSKLDNPQFDMSNNLWHEHNNTLHKPLEFTPDFTINNERLSLVNIRAIIYAVANYIISKEQEYCELDSIAGDGDFGASLASGFKQVLEQFTNLINVDTFSDLFNEVAIILMEYCGGASGPIWGAAFRGAAKSTQGKSVLTISDVADMLDNMVKMIQLTGERAFGRGAVIGDKTLIDALIPCAESWKDAVSHHLSMKKAFANGAKSAVDGAEQTKGIVAHMGRAGTVGVRSIGYPDAGAYALGDIFTHLTNITAKNERRD